MAVMIVVNKKKIVHLICRICYVRIEKFHWLSDEKSPKAGLLGLGIQKAKIVLRFFVIILSDLFPKTKI